MDFIGTKVKHKVFGESVIVAVEEAAKRVTVRFAEDEKIFQYPQCFQNILELGDESTKRRAIELIEQDNLIIQKQKEAEEEKQREQAEARALQMANEMQRRYPRQNIAFKCTYCNGGKTGQCFGFNGLCSDEQMRYNIFIEKRTWCNAEENPCRRYLEGKIPRSYLEEQYNSDNGSVCYESNLLRAWTYGAGFVVRGKNKGKPNALRGVQTNSLCVLTTRKSESDKMQRYIFGVFLVIRSEEGDDVSEGKVRAHPKYRIALTDAESAKLCFWNYYKNDSEQAPCQWGTGLFRYFDDSAAVAILQDICEIKRGTRDERLAQEILEYFVVHLI